jgi:hypothetical protein
MKNRVCVLRYIALFILLQTPFWCTAQKRGAVWCFGDSAMVDFSDTSNITLGTSVLKTRGSCVSISDTTGNLQFYAYTRAGINGNTTILRNSTDSIVLNGTSIVGEGWYRELVLFPFPGNDTLFILFSIGVTGSSQAGFYYSIVDMNANGGLGEVIQKNVQLQTFQNVDCLSAIKHGNGRDWWVFSRRWDNTNNEWSIYKVNDSGVSSPIITNVGSSQSTGFGNISFNKHGTRMSYINTRGLIELYDFDRCTGIISNPVAISQENTSPPYPNYWSAEFSPSGKFLYVVRIPAVTNDSSKLFQFDLTSPNIAASKQTLWTTPFMITMGQLKRAPDNKIYLTTNYYQLYPYLDTQYSYINMNLSVINSPDSLGLSCDLDTFGLYLGGKRSYVGLPNNPDYDLPALAGSPCDTLVGIGNAPQLQQASLNVFYHSTWQKAFINASNLKGKNGKLLVYDMQGKIIHQEPLRIQNGYYTRDLSMQGKAHGVYLVIVQTEKERLTRKMITD